MTVEKRCEIIAEIAEHNGDMSLAKELIHAAAENGRMSRSFSYLTLKSCFPQVKRETNGLNIIAPLNCQKTTSICW